MAPATLKMPKPKSFNGDKERFTEWFQHVEMFWAFNEAADDRKRVLVTCQFMDEGPAAAWAGAWCTKELNKSLQDTTKFSWRGFVYALKDAYAPINITGDAQARLCQLKQGSTLTSQFLIIWSQIMAEAGYGTIMKDTPEADHLIDLLKTNANQTIVYATVDTYHLHRTRDFDVFYKALKEVGKALEECNGGKVPAAPTHSRPNIPASVTRYIPTTSQPSRAEPPITTTPSSATASDRHDTTGVTYAGQGQPMDVGRAKGNRSRACYNCGETGHFSVNCPHPRAPRAQ